MSGYDWGSIAGFVSLAIVLVDKLMTYYPAHSIQHLTDDKSYLNISVSNVSPSRGIYVSRIKIFDDKLKLEIPITDEHIVEILPNDKHLWKIYMAYPVDVYPCRRINILVFWGVFGSIFPRLPLVFTFRSDKFRAIGGV